MEALSNSEQQLFQRLKHVTAVGGLYKDKSGIDELKNRLKLIEDEIQSGNDNNHLLIEAKKILTTLAHVYELAKSEQVQDLDKETPYESKQWNWVGDINSGVYTNSQQTLVQFDLSSIYNSGSFIDISQMYLTIPLVYTACYSSATPANVAPTAGGGNEWLITPKSGYWNLVQSLEVTVNGKTVIQQQPNVNFHTNFKMLSQMSKDDLNTLGKTLGMCPDDGVFQTKTEGLIAGS
eukprot:gene3364-3689_t